ncbi:MAG: hypothetical protein H7061_02325 [Bdellovibrionaceae bacterium]|nr:hypothetical protein [Bdellovibrio sp.]
MYINPYYRKMAAVCLVMGLLIFGFQNCSPKAFQSNSVADHLSGTLPTPSSHFSTAKPSMVTDATDRIVGGSSATVAQAEAQAAYGIRILVNGVASQGPFLAGQTVGVQIFGFDEQNTFICIDDMFGSTFYCDDSKYLNKLPNTLYGYKGFSYSDGQWNADFRASTMFSTYRITVSNSKGDKAVKIFEVKNRVGTKYPMNRQFVNGKVKNGPYQKGEIVEIRVYGYEGDVLTCTQESLGGTRGNATYDVHSCSDKDFVKISTAVWNYSDGIWSTKVDTNKLTLTNTYRYRFMTPARSMASVGGMIEAWANTNQGFVVGPSSK